MSENVVSPSGVYHNLKGFNFSIFGHYSMTEDEAKAILPLLEMYKNHKLDCMKGMIKDYRIPGKWIEYEKSCDDGSIYIWKKCSECSKDMIGYETDFCSHCGHKMDVYQMK